MQLLLYFVCIKKSKEKRGRGDDFRVTAVSPLLCFENNYWLNRPYFGGTSESDLLNFLLLWLHLVVIVEYCTPHKCSCHCWISPLSPYSYRTARPSNQSTASFLSSAPNGQFRSCRYCTHTHSQNPEGSGGGTLQHSRHSLSERRWTSPSWGCSSSYLGPLSCSVGSSGLPATRCSSWTESHLQIM